MDHRPFNKLRVQFFDHHKTKKNHNRHHHHLHHNHQPHRHQKTFTYKPFLFTWVNQFKGETQKPQIAGYFLD